MNMTLGRYISEIREAKGWSQSELARRCDCSPTQIQRLEDDRIESPGFKLVINIANALEISTNQLARAFEGKETLAVDPDLEKAVLIFLSHLPNHIKSKAMVQEEDVALANRLPSSLMMQALMSRPPEEVFANFVRVQGRTKVMEIVERVRREVQEKGGDSSPS